MLIDIHSFLIYKDNNSNIDNLIEDMIKHDISKRVITVKGFDNLKERAMYTVETVKSNPNCFVGCIHINPKEKNIINDLEYSLNFKEIKFVEFNGVEDGFLPDIQNNLDEIFSIISTYGKIVKIFSGYGMYGIPHQWLRFIRQYPNLKFIFLHMGCFDYGYSCVDLVLQNSNCYLETSNQYEMQILKKAFKNVSSNKILFGTMYPYRFTGNAIDIFKLFKLNKVQMDNIFYKNYNKLLGD